MRLRSLITHPCLDCSGYEALNMRTTLMIVAVLLVTSAVSAQLVAPTWGFLIPAAGAVQGANGTFFRSDITLTNYRSTPQMIQIRWLPNDLASVSAGVDNPIITTIESSGSIASEDFVTEVLHQRGLGAILITGWTPSLTVDDNALLFATARIWTRQPESTGTVSQSFPVIPMTTVQSPPAATRRIFGHRIDVRYRTNVGIVNLETDRTQVFTVTQSCDIPSIVPIQQTIEIGPLQMVQAPLGNCPAKNLIVQVRPWTPSSPASTAWAAYASSVDNITGDAWSNAAVPNPPQ